jgi:uncharacterized protein YndB with AHSA1/START domain
MESKNSPADRQLTVSRIIDAPLEMVWKAWTDPEQLKQWWGPKGFTNPVCQWEPEPGKKILIHMQGPDGITYPMDGEFLSIRKPEELVFKSGALDKNGKRLFEVLNTINFAKKGDRTELTMHAVVTHAGPEAEPYLSGMDAGWGQSLDKLEALISANPPLIIERIFNAPASKIWRAMTDTEEMKKWYFDLPEFKAEVGFSFQFLAGKDVNHPYLHLCEVTEVVPGKKLTYSWRYEGYPGNSLVTFELFEMGDQTIVKITHRGIETIAPGNPDFGTKNFTAGWTAFLDTGLTAYLKNN